jgi:hypothetical protein
VGRDRGCRRTPPDSARRRLGGRRTWAGDETRRAAASPPITALHSAGQLEIDIDGDTATGTWRFEDTVIATEYRVVITGAAFYEDRYVRCEDGQWRIAHTGYTRIYEASMSLDDLPSWKLTANRWVV